MRAATSSPAETAFAQPVPYATPMSRPARGWAGAAILFGGLCLIGLGGCFLIGVMGIVHPQAFGNMTPSGRLTSEQIGLMVVLYILAFASFGGAAVLLFLGTRALLRLLQ